MSELGRKMRATLNPGLVICLSLWAYYIQIKENSQIGDRLQHPHPIRPFPQGNYVVHTHVATASQHDATASSRSPPQGSWEAVSESAALLNACRVMYLKIKYCIYEHRQNMS